MSENVHKISLSSGQQKAIELLAAGMTKGQAAAGAGVAPRTLSRWLANPDFTAALTATTDQALEGAAVRMVAKMEEAISVIGGIMNDPQAPAATRIRAAEIIISQATGLKQLGDLAARISALEERANEDGR